MKHNTFQIWSSLCSIISFGAAVCLLAPTASRGQNNTQPTAKVLSIFNMPFSSVAFAQEANALRRLGKDKLIQSFRDYVQQQPADHVTVLVWCRVLFNNPDGWQPPSSGVPQPKLKSGADVKWPLFPIAIVDKCPFLLIQGYKLGGRGESASACLELCEKLAIVRDDLDPKGVMEAAKRLLADKRFADLYESETDHFAMEQSVRVAAGIK